ncbi:MAG: hypothetical protein E7257_08295 [Lachnospiraceae bacterium]|nr:hypothetical protein [Lachnospiraceae bacterium]
MKYCQECGYECADEVRFCEMCRYEFKVLPATEPVKQQMQANNFYNQNTVQQPQQPVSTLCVKNIMAMIAAVVCFIPFAMDEFAYIGVYSYKRTFGFIEFCQLFGDPSYCTSLPEKMVACIIYILPLLIFTSFVLLVISAFMPIIKPKRYLIIASILDTLIMVVYSSGESGGLSFKGAFVVLIMGLVLAVISCVWDKPESHSRVVYNGDWRCPKCDTRNSAEQKVCKACRVSRP